MVTGMEAMGRLRIQSLARPAGVAVLVNMCVWVFDGLVVTRPLEDRSSSPWLTHLMKVWSAFEVGDVD